MAVSDSSLPEVLDSLYSVSGYFSRLHDVIVKPVASNAAVYINIFFMIFIF